MRIGIVGTGIAGLTAGWLFRRAGFQVTLFEKQDSLGMGAHSQVIELGAERLVIDVPSRMFNPLLWPNLVELYEELGVEIVSAEPSKSFCSAQRNAYLKLGKSFVPALSPKLVFDSSVRAIAVDAGRMMMQARRDADLLEDNQQTFGDYLQANNYSDHFIYQFLFPALSSTVCTCSYSAIANYPAKVLLNAMLDISSSQGLFRTKFGTADVVDRLTNTKSSDVPMDVHLETSVASVKQVGETVSVLTQQEGSFEFDHFVLATQANSALRLLPDVSPIEKQALGCFQYEDVETIVHSDTILMPEDEKDWSSFNFISNENHSAAMCSIWVNKFAQWEVQRPIIQTILPTAEPDPSTILHRSQMQRPLVNLESQRGARLIEQVHAEVGRRIWFCGSYLGAGVPLLEGGVTSSLAVASQIGPGVVRQS